MADYCRFLMCFTCGTPGLFDYILFLQSPPMQANHDATYEPSSIIRPRTPFLSRPTHLLNTYQTRANEVANPVAQGLRGTMIFFPHPLVLLGKMSKPYVRKERFTLLPT